MTESVITELQKLGYAESAIKLYRRCYEDFNDFCEGFGRTEYTIGLGDRWLLGHKGIRPVVTNPRISKWTSAGHLICCLSILPIDRRTDKGVENVTLWALTTVTSFQISPIADNL